MVKLYEQQTTTVPYLQAIWKYSWRLEDLMINSVVNVACGCQSFDSLCMKNIAQSQHTNARLASLWL